MKSAALLHTRTVTWLRDSSWSALFGYAYFLIIAGSILRLAVPAAVRPSLRPLLMVAPLLPFVAALAARTCIYPRRPSFHRREPALSATVKLVSVSVPARPSSLAWRGEWPKDRMLDKVEKALTRPDDMGLFDLAQVVVRDTTNS